MADPLAAVDEAAFQRWYAAKSQQYGLNPNPDDPSQFYDYRSAFRAGATPDASNHWPSQFKRPGHPNEIVGGFNTRTGERVPGTPRAGEAELVRLGWDATDAKRLAAMPEPQPKAPERQYEQAHKMADQYVKLPDGSYARFPDTMSDEQIASVIKGTGPHQEGETWAGRISSWLPTAGGVVGGVLGGIGGTVAGMGVGGVPGAVGGAALGGAAGEAARQLFDEARGKPVPTMGQAAAGMAEQAGIQGGSELVGAGIAKAMKPAGEAIMQSALKPGLRAAIKSVKAGETPRVVKTLLDEGINVTASGIDKLNRIIGATNQEIKAALGSVPFDVNPYKVASRLGDTAQKFAAQVNPTADVEAVSRVGQEFLANHGGGPMAGQTAQALKTGTYQQLGSKAYTGELKGAEVEAQKALARGLKEEIEAEFSKTLPGIKGKLGLPGGVDIAAANAREGDAIQALDAVSRRVAVGGNNNPMGIASLAVSHPTTFLAAMMDRHPAVKSMLARGLYSSAGAAAKVNPQLIRAAVQAIATSPEDNPSPSTAAQ